MWPHNSHSTFASIERTFRTGLCFNLRPILHDPCQFNQPFFTQYPKHLYENLIVRLFVLHPKVRRPTVSLDIYLEKHGPTQFRQKHIFDRELVGASRKRQFDS